MSYRFLAITTLLAHTLPLTTPFSFANTNTARITGTVVDKEARIPLTHVQVLIEQLQRGDVTDLQGRFEIANLAPGTYDLVFQFQGYKSDFRNGIRVEANRTIHLRVALESTVIEFDELLVTANRRPNLENEISRQISVVTEKEIRDRNVHQTSEVLREETGIVVQKTNQGGGSPIIRGMKANKLLIMVDGIRMNNATYRGGNLQYLNTVDSATLKQMEVVHGPGSVLYGSDALGGVINVITHDPILADVPGYRLGGSGSVTLSSADQTQTAQVGLNTATSNWGLNFALAYKSFGNIRRGGQGGRSLMQRLRNDSRTERILNETQSPNEYETFDLNSKFLLKLSEFQELTAAFQFNRQESVPRYDVFEARSDSVFLFDPQERQLGYLRFRNTRGAAFYNTATITLSLHRQFERRLRQRFGSNTETGDRFETVTTGVQLQFNKLFARKHHVVYGSELYYDRVAAKSFSRNVTTGARGNRDPLFPNDASFVNFGSFLQNHIEVHPRWNLDLGARFSAFRLRAPFAPGTAGEQFGTVQQAPTSLTGSFGSLFKISDELSFVTNIAQGFRTPNLDDVSKLGPGKGSSFFDIPNPDVGPEKTVSFDGGFKMNSRRMRVNVIGYYNFITDLLLRRPAEFNGASFVVEQGDTLQVFRKENAGRAYTAGFEFSADLLLSSNSAVLGRLSFTRGQNRSDGEPLSAIPPLNGMVGFRWSFQNYQVELNSRFAAAQDRLSLEDQEDLRIPEGGTPGWYTVNLRLRADVGPHLTFNFGLSNLLDRNYREHLSGFNARGRNFLVGVRGNF